MSLRLCGIQTQYCALIRRLQHRLQFIPISKIPAAVNLKSSQIFSFVVPFPSKTPHPLPPPKKLSPPIQPSQSPNRIDNNLKGNKKIVSLWQAEGEICRLHVRICYVTKGHTGSFVLKQYFQKVHSQRTKQKEDTSREHYTK